MEITIQILIGVLTLVVLVGAFLASKKWHWAHVLVLVAFYFASVGYAILAARSLNTRLEYQEKLAKAEENYEQQVDLNDGLLRGTSVPKVVNQLAARDVLAAQETEAVPGTVELEHKLRLLSRDRGRVWRFASPTGPPDPQTSVVEVRFPVRPSVLNAPAEGEEAPLEGEEAAAEQPSGPPPSLGLETDAIVYVFEQGPLEGTEESKPNHYIGEFRVDAVAGRTAKLEPLDQLELDPVATERLLSSRGPWIVYESMPADDRELFAGMDDETLRRLLPESVVEQYLRDGTPAQPDDPEDRLVSVDADGHVVPPDDPEGKGVAKQYRRQMRDYTLLLNDLEAERAELVAREQAMTADIAKLEEALANAEKIKAYREEELAKWQADLAAVERERKAIEAHEAALRAQVANAQRLLAETLKENAQLASMRATERGVLVPFGSGALDIDAL
ncbi:hypothetical protein Pla108_16750 [Botrimarina colliarenosi]|uniref:Uncharacterized protein n=1 Tax=Botrimarina colliarenosi TaxID=2528001 RepID=A0A5C6AL27_9BACT|nr:hypothetical protein [Botrimarina colliarenosi]TWU00723.1 hypothetical protein Pla108_16750 [Botrimarina colliarenosi]